MAVQYLLTVILLLINFLILILLISFSKIDRTVITLGCAVVTIFLLVIIESTPYKVFVDFVVGTPTDGFVNFHVIVFLFSMLVIVQICIEGGVFQFLSYRLIQMTKGKPVYLLISFNVLTFFLTAIINDMLAILLIIPFTITVCKTLDVDSVPYVITEAITIKLGAILFLISSLPNIVVGTYLGLSFTDFFLQIGGISIFIFILTLLVFIGIYRKKLTVPKKRTAILLSFDAWQFIPNRFLMFKSTFVLVSVIIGFIVVPSTIVTPDLIAFFGAIFLILICGLNPEQIFQKINFKLILYLIGVFITVGGLAYINLMNFIGGIFGIQTSKGIKDVFIAFIMILWLSALLSAFIDNLTVTNILIPITKTSTIGYSAHDEITVFSGMLYGINLGDNLTPFGDFVILMDLANKNGCRLKATPFFKIAFPIAIFHLCIVTIIFSLLINVTRGLILLGIAIGIVVIIFFKDQIKDLTSKTAKKLGEYKNGIQKRL